MGMVQTKVEKTLPLTALYKKLDHFIILGEVFEYLQTVLLAMIVANIDVKKLQLSVLVNKLCVFW